jgi:hypothetical protein
VYRIKSPLEEYELAVKEDLLVKSAGHFVEEIFAPRRQSGSHAAETALGLREQPLNCRGRRSAADSTPPPEFWTALSGGLRAARVQPPVQRRPSGDPRVVAGVAQAYGRSMTGMRRNCYGRDFSSIFWISEGYQTSCPIQIQSVPSTF